MRHVFFAKKCADDFRAEKRPALRKSSNSAAKNSLLFLSCRFFGRKFPCFSATKPAPAPFSAIGQQDFSLFLGRGAYARAIFFFKEQAPVRKKIPENFRDGGCLPLSQNVFRKVRRRNKKERRKPLVPLIIFFSCAAQLWPLLPELLHEAVAPDALNNL